MWRGVLALIGLASGCGGKMMAEPVPEDASAPDARAQRPECVGASVPPPTLDCTGLYEDLGTKQLALGVQPFAPAVPLWSDGAEKQRWIALPEGTTIDATNPNEWQFPVGTKAWKEFSVGGKRVETRLFQKVVEDHWVHAAYAWNEDDSAAPISRGGDIAGPEGVYHIPTRDECDDCHKGRTDRLLGFEEVSLGLAGATGMTLERLVSEGLLTPAPSSTSLTLGDDGTGMAEEPLKWLHVNCGTSCHNDNPTSVAYGAKMRLRLDPALLDGRSSSDFDPLRTTVNVTVNNPGWFGETRIVPGDAARSLLVTLIENRGTDNPAGNQMPPIASRIVDRANVDKVIAWIAGMPASPDAP